MTFGVAEGERGWTRLVIRMFGSGLTLLGVLALVHGALVIAGVIT